MFFSNGHAGAQVRKFDPTFQGGRVITYLTESLTERAGGVIQSLALQKDGKLVALGNRRKTDGISDPLGGALARYNPDGTLDLTFGNQGRVFFNATNKYNTPSFKQVVVQDDGKILALGNQFRLEDQQHFNTALYLSRFQANGSLDTTFGENGAVSLVVTPPSYNAAEVSSKEIRLNADGSFRVYGYCIGFQISFVAQFQPDGRLDPRFGTGGFLYFPSEFSGRFVTTLVQADGSLVEAMQGESGPVVFLTRTLASGIRDPHFGTNGKVTLRFTAYYSSTALTQQPDGKLVLALIDPNAGIPDFGLVVRLLPDGSPDLEFGTNGQISFADPETRFSLAGLQSLADGSLLVAGTVEKFGQTKFLLGHYTSQGKPVSGFGTAGIVTTDFFSLNDSVTGLLIQPDGKIIEFGGLQQICFGMVRLLPDGTADPAFGDGGRLIIRYPLLGVTSSAGVLQSDGKILVAGTGYPVPSVKDYDYILARLNVDGRLDPDFGKGGIVITDLNGKNNSLNGIAVQPDGFILTAGTDYDRDTRIYTCVLGRYTPAGTPDASWGNNGFITFDFGNKYSGLTGLALQKDGKVVVVGYAGVDIALARFNPNGTPDAAFGNQGKVKTQLSFAIDNFLRVVRIQNDGKVVVGGYSVVQRGIFGDVDNGLFLRYTEKGELDSGFGEKGVTRFTISDNASEVINDFGLQPDGKIVGVGGTYKDSLVVRLLPDGSLDAKFGTNGLMVGKTFDGAALSGVAVQSDGKILVCGGANVFFGYDLFLVRLNTNGSLDTSFGDAGRQGIPVNFGNSSPGKCVLQPDGKLVVVGQSNYGLDVIRYDCTLPPPACQTPIALELVHTSDNYIYISVPHEDWSLEILINGKVQPTFYDKRFGEERMRVRTKLTAKQIKPGKEIRIQLRNGCGKVSPEYKLP